MNDDAELLHRYAAEGSQEAFAELVRRHLGLVYHAAVRQAGGDRHHAEEITQIVFTDLARKAGALSRRPLLVAWLHTTTRYAASQLRRTERRRQAREQAAFAMDENEFSPEPAEDWERLRPLIDDALQGLGERDRAAVLLRFFENRTYAELAATLEVSEDAARVRVNRALEKLRVALARRGLVSAGSALALALAQPALAATPAGLAAQVTSASLSAASAGTAAGFGATAFMSTTKIAAVVAGAITLLSLGVAHQRNRPASTPAAVPVPALSASDLAAILQPARLVPAEAADALAAYLALPPLDAGAKQAAFTGRAARLRALLTVLPPEYMVQLLAATASRPGDPEARLRQLAFTAWTEFDAPAAARWAAALETGPAINGNQRAVFASEAALAWARTDFDAAYAWATALRPGLARHVGGSLLARLVLTDSGRALALARAGDLAYFDAVRPRVFDAWLDQAPAASFAALGAEMFARPDDRASLPACLARWVWRDPPAALAWFDAQAFGEAYQRSGQLAAIIDDFARKNPSPDFAALGAALVARATSGLGGDRLEYFLRTWMSRDSAAALRWIDALPDAPLREQILADAASCSSFSEPKQVIQLARRLPPGPRRDETIESLLRAWSQKDPDAAFAWLDSADGVSLAGPDATRVVRISVIARQDPAAALATWNAIGSEDTRRRAAPALARAWATTDPAAAAAWLFAQIPEGPNSSDPGTYLSLSAEEADAYQKRMQPYWQYPPAYDTISSDWIARDAAGFVAWVERLPNAVQQRSALHSLSWGASSDRPDPAARLDLIATLRDPAVRDPLLGDYLRNWHLFDESAARRWAEAHGAGSVLPADRNPAP